MLKPAVTSPEPTLVTYLAKRMVTFFLNSMISLSLYVVHSFLPSQVINTCSLSLYLFVSIHFAVLRSMRSFPEGPLKMQRIQ